METYEFIKQILSGANSVAVLGVLYVYFKIWQPAMKEQADRDKKQDERVTDHEYRIKNLEKD